jgi:hypothetical protein
MSTQWSYRTLAVQYGDTGRGTQYDPHYDWCVYINADRLLVGWQEILTELSETGWEIFSVVGVEAATAVQTGGAGITTGFRIFAKKPK